MNKRSMVVVAKRNMVIIHLKFREISMLHANLMEIMVLKAKKNWMRLK